MSKGKVFLIGAGPGDIGLFTLKGKECLARADVVVYDELANRDLLGFAGKEARFIYVGKKAGSHSMPQDEINDLIVRMALEGHRVARLKGGDPFIFGRGGEEACELVKAGIPFEVVPGVTSAIAVPAYAGIPLTHRDHTSTVAFVTGHEDPTKGDSRIAWDHLASAAGTIVFLMGVGNLARICAELLKAGRSSTTPVAVIERGTLAVQRTVAGDLESIAEIAKDAKIRPPAIIIVGDVVKLRDQLGWFEQRPLFGRRIVVTRAREQASRFVKLLSEMGAECVEFPAIEIVPPESWEDLDDAIKRIKSFRWIITTSVNGVRYFLERLFACGKDARDLGGILVGAIGPKTAEAWHEAGIRPDLMPEEFVAEAVIELFRGHELRNVGILIPRAGGAREVLPEELGKMGAIVKVVTAYQTVKPRRDLDKMRGLLREGLVDMITFTSSSTVRNFLEMFSGERSELLDWMKRVSVACIGPVTANTARSEGLKVDLMPSDYTIEGFARAIREFYGKKDVPSTGRPG
ncbi:MAG: uroporphyrinogen-III C-methyltransferase [Desulfobacteraceae bacterium]|nr:MAG: uroporphyrinogen-III C-methyltransferase [Desulfobacteraceae bacterium]